MKIDILQSLKHAGQSFPFGVEVTIGDINVYGDVIVVSNPVYVDGTIIYTGSNFYLSGDFDVEYTTTCALCGDTVNGSIKCEFDEEFSVTEDEEHPDRYIFAGNSIDITKMVNDSICLNLPLKHLCKEDCKGLCAICGANLNKEECSCSKQVQDSSLAENETENTNADNPFAALKDLISDDNKEVQ